MSDEGTLDAKERQALADALDDEYKSLETYAQVIRDFGEVRPFINIVEAEARHIAALLALFDRFGTVPPENRWAGKAPRFKSVHAACLDSADAQCHAGCWHRVAPGLRPGRHILRGADLRASGRQARRKGLDSKRCPSQPVN